jgi:hypothetical protein
MKRGMIMSNHTIRKKSSHFDVKVKLRLTALEKLCGEDINILDCYHGNGDIYKKVEQSVKFDITGIEINDSLSPFKCIKGDNLKIIDEIDLRKFNVIDLDAYTDCTNLLKKIIPKLTQKTLIIYTMIINRMAGMPKNLIMNEVAINNKIKTITNKFINEKWAAFLKSLGVETYKEITFSENCFLKKYGYFIV